MNERKKERGQAMVETVFILPVLLLLLLGVAEMGFALRNYLVVVNASREGARFAARGRYSWPVTKDDDNVIARVVIAGGAVQEDTFSAGGVPFLRTDDNGTHEPNTGIIITHVSMISTGVVVSSTQWYSGVIQSDRIPIDPNEHSLLDTDQVAARHSSVTAKITALRADQFEPMNNHVVVVEVFYLHDLILNLFPRQVGSGERLFWLPDPWQMYARTEMRIITDRERE